MKEARICRLCLLNNNTEHFNIFTSVDTDLIMKMENCLSIKVEKDDNLPKFMCLDCLRKVNLFDNFKKMCLESYKYLTEERKSREKTHLENANDDIFEDKTELKENENDFNSDYDYNDIEDEVDNLEGNTTSGRNVKKDYWDEVDDSVEYYDHQESHNGELVFKCDKCDMIFRERNLLLEHDRKHRVPCTICKIQVLPKSLKAHLLIHTDIHKCSICNMRHTSKASLEKHIQARHTKVKGFVCHVCGKQNSCQSSMNRHMAYHSNERPYKCKYCDFSAKSLNIVQVHSSRKHFAERCVCEICAKIFKSQPSLIQHMKRIHTDKRHVCGICSKEFIEKYNLNKHMKKHVGQRLHECKICQKEFFTVRKLKEHMHSHRQGCCVNCPKCGREFFYKKYYNKHVLKCNKTLEIDFVSNLEIKRAL